MMEPGTRLLITWTLIVLLSLATAAWGTIARRNHRRKAVKLMGYRR